MADPTTWLREKGFDPEGDLCTAIERKSRTGVTATAMFEAVCAGPPIVPAWRVELIWL